MLRRLFGKEKTRDDKLTEAVRVITGLLDNQASFAQMQNLSMKDEHGNLKRKALGYVYGYIDCALRAWGLDMKDMDVGPPVTFHVLRRLWPEHHAEYMDFLAKNISHDPILAVGVLNGGQQFLDYVVHKKVPDGIPMGLVLYMLDGD
jgi:hypothetical protein